MLDYRYTISKFYFNHIKSNARRPLWNFPSRTGLANILNIIELSTANIDHITDIAHQSISRHTLRTKAIGVVLAEGINS